MNEQSLKQNFAYDRLIHLWRTFCELHTLLYDLTCEEYANLLASDFDALEQTVKHKEQLLIQIGNIEEERKLFIAEINQERIFENEILNIHDLIECLKQFELEKSGQHLSKFNLLLVDIIERIQAQNKKNQIFLNRAMQNLKDIKNTFSGKKNYQTYTAHGTTK
ncbi:MAG: flagellar export chaperone FlgN [Bacteriovoracaceae bacterium]|nr:flagellar export chaperone FlgN [Bacteriovoracaceae bacterium]